MKLRNQARVLDHLARSRAEEKAVQRDARESNVLTLEGCRNLEKSERDWYILGSGASVLNLTRPDWARIRSGTSIGLNSWAFHSFVPNILAVEEVDCPELRLQSEAMSAGLMRIAESDQRPLILKFRGTPSAGIVPRLDLPVLLQPFTRIYGRLQVPPLSEGKELQGAISFYLNLDRVGLVSSALLLDQGASLVRMIHFATRCGAKRIFLVGIDLGLSPYFYEDDPSFLESLGIPRFTRKGSRQVHGTQLEREGSRPVTEFLANMTYVLEAHKDVQVRAINGSRELLSVVSGA